MEEKTRHFCSLWIFVARYISVYLYSTHDFFCVGVMYSGEYDACDVTLSVYPHRASSVEKYA
jgi:hypothetical protein